MDGHLKCSCICLSIFLLVLPLVCSEYEENNGNNDMEELLQNLLKAEKERRPLSDDKNAEGSRGTEQGRTNDDANVQDINAQKRSDGSVVTEVKKNNEMTQKIIQDCENKYELMLVKNEDKPGGSCYLHKMNDRIYQKDCGGIETEDEQIILTYEIGKEIVNKTLLSSIKGIEGCMGQPVIEMFESSKKSKGLDEYEKRLAERRGCKKCKVYNTDCKMVCADKTGWWWGEKCVREVYQCDYQCKYDCR
ncbi:hypothetical protein ACJMK2_012939 [Sinanodonta woodiana]|uniref:Uncharacterized protein n=1 Tax=Sinanodonta woodiana TaxID=1069815 RepID=A0ABD3VBE2_SINWO